VEYVVNSASVCLLELMGTSTSALVTGTKGTPRASPSVLK